MKEKNSGISIGNILAVVGLAALAWVFGPSLLGAIVGGGEVVVTAVPGPGPVIIATPTLAPDAPVHVVQPAAEAAAGQNVPQWTGDAAVAGEAIVALIASVTEQLKACTVQQAADPFHNYRCYQFRDQLQQLNNQARQLAREVNTGGQQ